MARQWFIPSRAGGTARDRLLLAALGYALVTACGTAVAIRYDSHSELYGLQVPLPVRTVLITGIGAGTAAPWPVVVTSVVAASRARRSLDRTGAVRACLVVGLMQITGTLSEPVTWGRRTKAPSIWAMNVANLAAGAALTLTAVDVLGRGTRVDT